MRLLALTPLLVQKSRALLPVTTSSSSSSHKYINHRVLSTAIQMTATTSSIPSTTQNAAKKPKEFKTTLYKRELPSSCTAFNSKAGKRRLTSALAAGGCRSFFALMEQHTTQSEPAYCGLATLIVVLNAFAVDPKQAWKQGVPWRWYQSESMLNCCMDLDKVQEKGITLSDFACLAICQGLSVDTRHAEDPEAGSLQEFRKAVQLACVEDEQDGNDNDDKSHDTDAMTPRHILVVSYNRQTLGQTGTGHFSPIAAYDAATDSVLILDTARFKYGAHWVPLELLHQAMLPHDPATNKSRGFVILSTRPEDAAMQEQQVALTSQHNLPVSILFRFKFDQPAQKLQAEFYNTLLSKQQQENGHDAKRPKTNTPTWQDVFRFWTQDGTNLSYIYKILEPQLKPPDAATTKLVQVMLDQIQQLLAEALPSVDAMITSSSTTQSHSCSTTNSNNKSGRACRPNRSRTLALGPEQAIFLVYLASLNVTERESLLRLALSSDQTPENTNGDNNNNELSTMAQEQLLASAELLETVFGLAANQQQQQE